MSLWLKQRDIDDNFNANTSLRQLYKDGLHVLNGVNASFCFINDKVNVILHMKPTQIRTLFISPIFVLYTQDGQKEQHTRSGNSNPPIEYQCVVIDNALTFIKLNTTKPKGFIQEIKNEEISG